MILNEKDIDARDLSITLAKRSSRSFPPPFVKLSPFWMKSASRMRLRLSRQLNGFSFKRYSRVGQISIMVSKAFLFVAIVYI